MTPNMADCHILSPSQNLSFQVTLGTSITYQIVSKLGNIDLDPTTITHRVLSASETKGLVSGERWLHTPLPGSWGACALDR